MNNVKDKIEICSGCGICVAVCPVKSIVLKSEAGFLRPKINDSCVNCGKCISMCPNMKQDSCDYSFFDEYVWGHSNNESVRREAASGGVTSELLHYLMEQHIVDYVVTADRYAGNSVCMICAPDLSGIYEKAGSNYCPVDMSDVIGHIRQREGRCAVVCLPCYARGLRNIMLKDKELSAKVRYIISLLCNHVPGYQATEYLLRKHNVKEVDEIRYRGDGWFGNFRAYKEGKRLISVPFSEYFSTAFSRCFWQKACVECKDHFGKYADICMGDADFVKYRYPDKENLGETICFIINHELRDILNRMANKHILELYDDVDEKELQMIYGPLSDTDRTDGHALEQDIDRIFRAEKGNLFRRLKHWLHW